MNADTFIIGQLAAYAIQQGARHGGVANMFAVAHVIHNRVRQGWFGGNWIQILEAARETEGVDYSFDPYKVELQKFPIRSFLERVDDIYDGAAEDIYTTGRGVYFCELIGPPVADWFVQNIIRQPDEHPRVGQVGPVVFFG